MMMLFAELHKKKDLKRDYMLIKYYTQKLHFVILHFSKEKIKLRSFNFLLIFTMVPPAARAYESMATHVTRAKAYVVLS